MKGKGKSKSKSKAPKAADAAPAASAAKDGSATLPEPGKDSGVSPAGAATGPPAADEEVAVLELSESGEIHSARDACLAIFGWDAHELVGKNIRVLLKDGLDNEVGRFLHRHQKGKNPTETCVFRVVALRKGDIEFPAQVRTRTRARDNTTDDSEDRSQLCWTALIQDLAAESRSAPAPGEADSPASAPQDAAPSLEAPKAETPAEQLTPFDLKLRIRDLESQLNQTSQELAGATAEIEKLGSREVDLLTEIETAKGTTSSAESRLKQEIGRREKLEERLQNLSERLRIEQAERSQRFAEELVGLRQERDDLNEKLKSEQCCASDSTLRVKKLETCLSRNALEFEKVKAELERQAAEREQSECSWRERFDTACIAKRELEGGLAGAIEINTRLEEELAKLRKEHDELNQKLAGEQRAVAEANLRAQEVESSLRRNAADSDRARTELEKQDAERDEADSEWREQLEVAKAVRLKLEGSLADATERIRHLDDNTEILRCDREKLQQQLEAEREAAHASEQEAEDLRQRMDQDAAELERLSATVDDERAQHLQSEAQAHEREEAAQKRIKELEADCIAASERNRTVDAELADLRREVGELTQKLVAEQNRVAESERARARLESDAAKRERAEAEMREELKAAKACNAQLKRSSPKRTARVKQLEEELADFQAEREQLADAKAVRLALESSLAEATERVKTLDHDAEVLRHDRDELQEQLRTAEQAAQKRIGELEADCAAANERNRTVDAELEDLQHEVGELNQKLAAEQDRIAGAKRACVEMESHAAKLERAEAEMREQLKTIKAHNTQLNQTLSDGTARIERLEDELAALRDERDELLVRLKAEHKLSEESGQRVEQLERRVEQDAGELERLAADLERSDAEREEVEQQIREQQEAAKTSARKLEADWAAAVERTVRLEKELAILRHERDELAVQLKSEQKSSAQASDQLAGVQRQLDRVKAELKRINAEAERLRSDRGQADAEWNEQLAAAKALASKLDAAWTEATERNRQFEAEIVSLKQEREELHAELAATRRKAVDFESRLPKMGGELQRRSRERPGRPLQSGGPGNRAPAPKKPITPREADQQTDHHEPSPVGQYSF